MSDQLIGWLYLGLLLAVLLTILGIGLWDERNK